ncbi:hypothetical protein BESB_080490 [Besnoitia besnoiti]|uniref:ThiS family protein n=1 Tax=Besnoitia besnoiti TaxID=94643 RepID=A0A2A9MDT4_BESBE|nr:hypothetical protein BESB_080490 [Besnoitia besnoiti]PFH33833.1 hypothetical protein BESB_080490 [Besnoitia besnoiti]
MHVRLLLFASAREALGVPSMLLFLRPAGREETENPRLEDAASEDAHRAGSRERRLEGRSRPPEIDADGCAAPAPSDRAGAYSGAPAACTVSVAALLALIAEQAPSLATLLPSCALAVDRRLLTQNEEVELTRDSELALLPPVSGG